MLFLDRRRVLENVRLATVCLAGLPPESVVTKQQLIDALNAAQDTTIGTDGDKILVEFGNEKLVQSLVRRNVFSADDVAGRSYVFSPSEQQELQEKVHDGLKLIQGVAPGLCSLIESVVGSVAMYRIPGKTGGTISSHIGLIWLSPKPEWTSDHLAELLVHEFVHNSVFLEDMVNGLFPDLELLDEKDALVTSTIRGTLRGYDKSYHSACVAAALMYFYHLLGDEAEADTYEAPLRKTVEELEDRRDALLAQGKVVITDTGAQITHQLREFVTKRSYDGIAARLAS